MQDKVLSGIYWTQRCNVNLIPFLTHSQVFHVTDMENDASGFPSYARMRPRNKQVTKQGKNVERKSTSMPLEILPNITKHNQISFYYVVNCSFIINK